MTMLVRNLSVSQMIIYGKKSFLSKESDTLRSCRVYLSPTMEASSASVVARAWTARGGP